MIFIDFPDCCSRLLESGLEIWVEAFIFLFYRFVEEFISEYYRLIGIAGRDFLPDSAKFLHILLALEQLRIAIAVVNVRGTALSSRSHVHVQNKVESGFLAPGHHPVNELESHFRAVVTEIEGVVEHLVGQRHTYCVRPDGVEIEKVVESEVILHEALPPRVHVLVA